MAGGLLIMEYNPLKTMNPTDEDLTLNSSVWLTSRLMPGKGNNNKISFPDFRIRHNAAMRTVPNFNAFNGLAAMHNDEAIFDATTYINHYGLGWAGMWSSNFQPIIGHCTQAQGLIAPMNTFNIGYRYRRGWRPSRVN